MSHNLQDCHPRFHTERIEKKTNLHPQKLSLKSLGIGPFSCPRLSPYINSGFINSSWTPWGGKLTKQTENTFLYLLHKTPKNLKYEIHMCRSGLILLLSACLRGIVLHVNVSIRLSTAKPINTLVMSGDKLTLVACLVSVTTEHTSYVQLKVTLMQFNEHYTCFTNYLGWNVDRPGENCWPINLRLLILGPLPITLLRTPDHRLAPCIIPAPYSMDIPRQIWGKLLHLHKESFLHGKVIINMWWLGN